MAITNDFNIHPSVLLANALKSTGDIGSYFGKIASSQSDSVYRIRQRIFRKISSI
jgi:hypothetical protein